ncbi:RNA polymerase subunit sigma [Vibrio sp. 10N.286.49.C2]|uniref:RNA polymerase sigma factor SigZ n=1 Tax=unclassified Vibrio TaxID=2614977 RepID=UPI000C84B894|nr:MULTISPECIES: RNA polymerase sigma factor SigZ [unclassified Vibrio]PMH42784.1 RNA polymerase subunit sigma [Vibrio sp. 10N.286.49.C2]PMH53878.1 RNA polymerase subunit sigma [Vibrio sp. 10N.286.49.B1]PMH79471.1 RNA polymerase subunit sigma [Vibrio sp. 10N.286.48.B7]
MLTQWLEHHDQLRGYIVKQMKSPDVADDILQDVYLKASQKQHQLKSQDHLKSWLFRITHNAIMDFYRSQQIHDELNDDHAEEELTVVQTNLQEVGQCLRPILECLPEKYRRPMVLSELEGLSQQQVADQLELSLSATKSRIQRGRVKLKDILIDYCNMEFGREGIIDFHPEPECKHLLLANDGHHHISARA